MTNLTMRDIKEHPVPRGSFVLWWLGQSSYLMKSPEGKVLALDPYLSNSCKAIGEQVGLDMDRQIPPPMSPEDLLGIDFYVLTHSHQDHLDPDTLGPYRGAGGNGPYLAPAETVEKLESLGVPKERITMTWPNKEVVVGDLTIRATFAIPFSGDDLTHVGYLVSVKDGPTVYFTGDTDYHDLIAVSVAEHRPDVMVAVINGAFRNMGPAEAARLGQRIDAKVIIPSHYDLFPDNAQHPQMLRTNLNILGLADRYRVLEHGKPYQYPEND
ncbi:MAG: MBL fold metallo-hydrolase [Candidatus Omnitrophica bacterium]|nr:MBL fold metallo-hydrolase [Candidatus Omnitrophota bacterium]